MGEKQIKVSFPDELASLMKVNEADFASEMRLLAIVKLYEIGKVSSGKAANLLGMHRIDFLETVGRYQVSILGEPGKSELEDDLLNA
ncbi:MAG: UPF0175 family protein [Saprospiraceae bacterium]|nr:UPF0175 family protein [Saprospiraceae bacterium]